MNILFLTLLEINSIDERGIYQDLLRQFTANGDKVFIVSPCERRKKQNTHTITDGKTTILRPKIGNTQKTNIIEKGISTLTLEGIIKRSIKQNFKSIHFDLVLYSTPPITLCNVVKYIKKRDKALSYLLLKDIFPQNAVDLEMFSDKSIFYKLFRGKEKRLYALSDYIGCMSPANISYLLSHNQEIDPKTVELCPNSIEPVSYILNKEEKYTLRKKYKLPLDKKIFIYGGNLGAPQAIDFMLEGLKRQAELSDRYFIIAGSGTHSDKVKTFIKSNSFSNICFLNAMPKEDYDKLVACCDVGLIFLDSRFTIPNYPSRLLSYMQAGLPVLAAIDSNTDIGSFLRDKNIGDYCISKEPEDFVRLADEFCTKEYNPQHIYSTLCESFNVADTYLTIRRRCDENNR